MGIKVNSPIRIHFGKKFHSKVMYVRPTYLLFRKLSINVMTDAKNIPDPKKPFTEKHQFLPYLYETW